MTEPNGNGPMGPEDELAALAGLDLALDELAARRDLPTEGAGGETAGLATLAAELREAGRPRGAGRRSWPRPAGAGPRARPGGARCPCGWPPWPRRWS